MRITVTAETLDDAINNAMIELQTTSDNIEYEVIQEGTTGFLGIGAKPYKIEAFRKDDKQEQYKKETKDKKEKLVENENGVYEFKSESKRSNNSFSNEKMERNADEAIKKAKEFLNPIFKEFNTEINIESEVRTDENLIVLNLTGEKMGVIIGKHGQTLDAIQHLVNIVVNNNEKNRVKIRIDSEKYRDKRYKTLESLAKSVANNVRKSHKSYALEPMPSYERKIIHSILQKERNIETESMGIDNNRHVVVKYKR